MTLTDARTLQQEIRTAHYGCIVPLGYGPHGYFCRIFGTGPIDFHTRQAFRTHHAHRLRESRNAVRAARDRQQNTSRLRGRPPIERMIDRACGLP